MVEGIPGEFDAFLAEPRNAILCIARVPGAPPHATPVWYEYADGRFRISITRERVKYRLIQREPQVTLVIDDDSRFQTVIVSGRAALSDDDASLLSMSRTLRRKYGYGAADTPDEELLRQLHEEQRVVLTVVPSQVVTWAND
jgi:PPOX class probable F420-dependent enzyme